MKKIKDISNNIIDMISKKNRIKRIILTTFGCFIVAVVYNCFIVPNNLVTGGLGGTAILVSKITGIKPVIFIDAVSILLIIISYILIGHKKTFYSIFGFVMYAIMASLTEGLSSYFTISLDSFLFSTIIASIVSGFGYGIIYKAGFNTGGMDSVVAILQKYISFPTTKISTIVNLIVILLGTLLFGIPKTIYAIIYLKLQNFIADRVILGTSNHKVCFIKTKKIREIEDIIINKLETGYTLIESEHQKLIMCVVSNDRFRTLKKHILKIDDASSLITNDCYTVEGGKINFLFSLKDF